MHGAICKRPQFLAKKCKKLYDFATKYVPSHRCKKNNDLLTLLIKGRAFYAKPL